MWQSDTALSLVHEHDHDHEHEFHGEALEYLDEQQHGQVALYKQAGMKHQ